MFKGWSKQIKAFNLNCGAHPKWAKKVCKEKELDFIGRCVGGMKGEVRAFTSQDQGRNPNDTQANADAYKARVTEYCPYMKEQKALCQNMVKIVVAHLRAGELAENVACKDILSQGNSI